MPTSKTLVLESVVAVSVVVAISALLWPGDLGLSRPSMHPMWLAAILLGARYGPAGLFSSLALIMVVVVAAPLVGLGHGAILSRRLSAHADLYPLLGAVGVTWVAMSHLGRSSRSEKRYEDTTRDIQTQRQFADALHASNTHLQARCDRMDASVNFWRWVSRSLERGDLAQAADAALLLCIIRSGANAGCVARAGREGLVLIATQGTWTSERPLNLAHDKTMAEAQQHGTPAIALDLPDASECDCDVAVPILDDADGTFLGVIALRDMDPRHLGSADVGELALISEWLAPSLARQIKGPRLHAAIEQSV